MSEVAQHVVTMDISPEMLTVAREKGLTPDRVEFRIGYAYTLKSIPGTLNAGVVITKDHLSREKVVLMMHAHISLLYLNR